MLWIGALRQTKMALKGTPTSFNQKLKVSYYLFAHFLKIFNLCGLVPFLLNKNKWIFK